ncbi:uncharacterized protein UBRO_20258 [Ustilago bromivora]|uniref:Retroviral polymerase SH3-like domain-containing protein n=1 Tax=Ustilago bromivora TaxID=307758 RepID=A0A1K0G395_9BASI|nr:uncharacterized protein UBRO_20258 [Ustilago bromivora]
MNLTPSVDNEFPYQNMFGKSPERLMGLICVFGCLAWVNIPKVKQDSKKLDQQAITSIFIGYSLERKGWLSYSSDYNPNVFWSNSAKFMESKCWSDQTEWRLIDTQSPPAMTTEEDFNNLGYTEENIFDERDKEPVEEYMDMESILEANEEEILNEDVSKSIEHKPNAKTWIDDRRFGLTATNTGKEKNLDPTVWEALAGEDKRHWEEAMRKELDRLEAMGTWEIADLSKGMNMVDT